MTTDNESTTQEQDNDQMDQQDQDTIEATATVIEETKPVKKSSGGIAWLGLLVALGALALSAYNHYFGEQNPTEQQLPDYSAEINSLTTQSQSQQSAVDQHTETIRDIEQQLQQLQARMETLSSNPATTEPPETVDLSPLQQQLDTLQNELAQIRQTQQQLQTSMASIPTEQTTSEPTPQVSLSQFQNAMVRMDALEQRLQDSLQQQVQSTQQQAATPSVLAYTINKQLALAELYLSLDLPQAAIESLQVAINNESRKSYPGFTGQIERAVQQINSTAAVDNNSMSNQLQQIDTAISQLQLATQKTEVGNGSWYDKFITIRKVDNNAAVQSSTELNLLKSALQHQLMLAQLALQTKNQNQWDAHLNNISTGLQAHFAEQQALITQVESLRQQQIRPQYPSMGLLIDSFQQIQQATGS